MPVVSRGHPGELGQHIVPSPPASLLKGQSESGQLGGWEDKAQLKGPLSPSDTAGLLEMTPEQNSVPSRPSSTRPGRKHLGPGRGSLGLPVSYLSESNRASWALLVQFLSCLVQLPPLLSTTDILWLSCFCYPLLR